MFRNPRYIVVLGAARSGTKFLRDLIASSEACTAIPFDVNHVWRIAHVTHPDDQLVARTANPPLLDRIEPRLRELSGWGQHPTEYIVEKTVSNCLRVPYVEQILGQPYYIHIVRDGRDVIRSAYREWNKPVSWTYIVKKLRVFSLAQAGYLQWAAKNWLRGRLQGHRGSAVWGVRYPGIEQDLARISIPEICAWQWVHCQRQTRAAQKCTPPNRWLTLHYEELVNDPSTVNQLSEFLKLPDGHRVREFYRDHLEPRPQFQSWETDEELDWKRAFKILQPELEYWNYMRSGPCSKAA